MPMSLFKNLYKECILMHRDCCWQVQYCSAGEETLSICTASGRNPLWCHHCGWDHCHPHPGDAQYTLAHQTTIHNVTLDWTCKSCVCVFRSWVSWRRRLEKHLSVSSRDSQPYLCSSAVAGSSCTAPRTTGRCQFQIHLHLCDHVTIHYYQGSTVRICFWSPNWAGS